MLVKATAYYEQIITLYNFTNWHRPNHRNTNNNSQTGRWSVFRVAAVWKPALRTQHPSKIWPPNVCNPIAACSGHCITIAPKPSFFETTANSWSTAWLVVSQESAWLELLENVEMELAQLPEYKRRNLEEIDKLATLIISRMARIQPQLSSWLDATTVGWLIFSICAFFSLLFCLLFMFSCPIFSQIIKKLTAVFRFA